MSTELRTPLLQDQNAGNRPGRLQRLPSPGRQFSRVGPAPPQPERRGEGAEMLLLHGLTGKNKQAWKEGKIRGMAVLVKSGVLDLGDFNSSVLDGIHKILDSQGRWRLLPSRQRHRTQPPEMQSTMAGESVFPGHV
uniref:Uncharacterized protein n=2 Tax=Aegilops tauschii subsp. strangulata TaxID=200361 RepID=A0A453NM93_AEGTS|nr:probable linoleate 9S-lipoxygenase 4 [Aegilops tauschii subsp. strangulata]